MEGNGISRSTENLEKCNYEADRVADCSEENNGENAISSSEAGILKGGHALRHRVPEGADAWRELSKTPPPSGSSARSFSSDAKHRRAQFQNLDRPSKSFADFSKEFEENEKSKTAKMKGDMSQKTIEDYAYKGFKGKRNEPSGFKENIESLYLRLMEVPSSQLIIAALIFFVIVIGGVTFFSGNKETQAILERRISWHRAQIDLMRDMVKLNKNFPSQNKETAIHLISAINSTMSEKLPKQPSAITILTPPSMQRSKFATCFISKVSSVVNRLFSRTLNLTMTPPVKILDKTYFNNGNSITAIHEDVESYFIKGGKAVIVHSVDELDMEEHLLFFHSFCDNFKAPDKRATFFFIVPVPLNIQRKYSWNQMFAADISNDVLNRAWKEVISDDSRPAMISRVAATVVLLNDGDSCS